jgi:hypothetical protein
LLLEKKAFDPILTESLPESIERTIHNAGERLQYGLQGLRYETKAGKLRWRCLRLLGYYETLEVLNLFWINWNHRCSAGQQFRVLELRIFLN